MNNQAEELEFPDVNADTDLLANHLCTIIREQGQEEASLNQLVSPIL